MAGGIIQISSYGNQDLFLTGAPEITFFKVVYKRHTFFSMESVKVTFDDPVSFGKTSMVIIPKIGDLMYKTYVEITLPEIKLLRLKIGSENKINKVKAKLLNAKKEYKLIQEFMHINSLAFKAAYNNFIPENNNNASKDMILSINNIFDMPHNIGYVDKTKELICLSNDCPFTYSQVSMQDIANYGNNYYCDKDDLFKAVSQCINKSVNLQKFYFERIIKLKEKLKDLTNPNIKFAWVKRLGHALFESIEIKIGGQKIDKHYGDWLNIWYELTNNKSMQEIYYKLIGNVEELTTFDRSVKPKYKIRIPLQFWFCRYSNQAIPLIALEYHNVSLHIKFRKFQELCYIEENNSIKLTDQSEGLNLDDVPSEIPNINIRAKLLIDYIFLDKDERSRFAQSSHEYLIDQLQVLEKKNVCQEKIQIQLNNFMHPSKELIWVAQKEKYINNDNQSTQCQWTNYSVSDEGIGNPILYSSMDFNSYKRVPRLDSHYFNYVVPRELHQSTPADGINNYGFALFPQENQISGSANLSCISRITLHLEIDPVALANDSVTVRIYNRDINILRFVSGFAGLSWT